MASLEDLLNNDLVADIVLNYVPLHHKFTLRRVNKYWQDLIESWFARLNHCIDCRKYGLNPTGVRSEPCMPILWKKGRDLNLTEGEVRQLIKLSSNLKKFVATDGLSASIWEDLAEAENLRELELASPQPLSAGLPLDKWNRLSVLRVSNVTSNDIRSVVTALDQHPQIRHVGIVIDNIFAYNSILVTLTVCAPIKSRIKELAIRDAIQRDELKLILNTFTQLERLEIELYNEAELEDEESEEDDEDDFPTLRSYKDWDDTIMNCKCETIKEFRVDSWDNWSERSWSAAFNKWPQLTSISLIGWEFSRHLDISHFLLNCPRLKTLNFNGSIVLSVCDELNERAGSLQLETLAGENISIHQNALMWIMLNCVRLRRLKCDSIVDIRDIDANDPILTPTASVVKHLATNGPSLTYLQLKSIPAPNIFISNLLPKRLGNLRYLNMTLTNHDSHSIDLWVFVGEIFRICTKLRTVILSNELPASNPKSVIKISSLILHLRRLRHLELKSFEIDELLIKKIRRSLKYLDYLNLM